MAGMVRSGELSLGALGRGKAGAEKSANEVERLRAALEQIKHTSRLFDVVLRVDYEQALGRVHSIASEALDEKGKEMEDVRAGSTDNVRMRKEKLLEVLNKNKNAHRDLFLKAQEGYREKAIEELEKALDRAKNHKAERVYVALPWPEDHTSDYERIIRMVEYSVDNIFELDEQEFARYVLDNWEWKKQWTATSAAYLSQ